ncbi:MAG: FecR domain-containing protein [Pseudomonadota bacterium]
MTTDRNDHISGIDQALINEALEWRAEMDDANVDSDKRAAFHQWVMSDPSHMQAFDYAERFWEQLKVVSDTDVPQPASLLDVVYARQLQSRRRFSVAASLVSFALVAVAIALLAIDTQGDEFETQVAVTYSTDLAESRTFALADGSQVFLGPGSRLETLINRESRAVSLLTGEGYFDVAEDVTRPFSVSTRNAEILVVGTQFNVRAANTKTHVAVAEGLVKVDLPAPLPEDSPTGPVSLNPGQAVVLEQGSVGEVSTVSVALIGAWRDNRLAFFNEPLAGVVEQVNRYDRREILLGDPEVATLTVSATLDASDIDSLLDTLAEIYPLSVTETRPNQLVITRKK